MNRQKAILIPLNILLLTFSLTAAAERPWPGQRYNCHTLNASGESGLVALQTDSLKRAKELAVGETAISTKGEKVSVTSVVECVKGDGEENFSSSTFQEFVDKLAE